MLLSFCLSAPILLIFAVLDSIRLQLIVTKARRYLSGQFLNHLLCHGQLLSTLEKERKVIIGLRKVSILNSRLVPIFATTVSRQECERQQCERHQCEANSANANSAKGSTVRKGQQCECQQCECDSGANASSANATAVRKTILRTVQNRFLS